MRTDIDVFRNGREREKAMGREEGSEEGNEMS